MTFDRDETVWESYDGRKMLIRDIEANHFVNIINWVRSNKKAYPKGLLEFLEEEAKLRRILAFSNNQPFPQKKPTGYYELANISLVKKLYNKAKLLIIKRKLTKLIAKKG